MSVVTKRPAGTFPTVLRNLVVLLVVAACSAWLGVDSAHADFTLRCYDWRESAPWSARVNVTEGDQFVINLEWDGHSSFSQWAAEWNTQTGHTDTATSETDYTPRDDYRQTKRSADNMDHTFSTIEDDRYEGDEMYQAGYSLAEGGHEVDRHTYCPVRIIDDDDLKVDSAWFSSTPADGHTYRTGEWIEIAVKFNGQAVVDGDNVIGFFFINTTAIQYREAHYRRGSGSDTLVFGYQVAVRDRNISYAVEPHRGTILGNGTIYGRWTNGTYHREDTALRSLPAGDGEILSVDGRRYVRSVLVTSRPLAGDTYGWSETIEVQVTFDREVVVSGLPVVSLTVGGDWRGASYTSGSGTKVLTFHYQVVEDDTDTDGISIHASNSAGSHGLVGTGSSITDSEFGSTANRAYSRQSNLSGHKVAGRPSGDAKLSTLELSDGTNPIALHQTFDAQTTAYTAEVGNTVGTITVTPTTNDDYATVAYLDAANAVLADTDTIADHHQVALDVGANTIKVRVTAENTTTTKTYTVRVNRVPVNLDAPTNLVAVPVSETRVHLYWGAPLNFALGGPTGYEYRMSTDGGHTWSRKWRDIQGSGNRTDITEHTVHWLDSANEYTFQVRAEGALGGGLSASVKARLGKPAVSRPTLTIEKIAGKDSVAAGKLDSSKRVQGGSLVNGVFVGNGTYHDSCHEDAIAHYRIRATGGDHLWRPGSRFRGVSVGVEYWRAGRNGERSSAGVSSSVTGLVGRIAGSIVPGNRHWDRKNCIATEGADRGPLIVRLVPGEGYFVGRPRAICIRVDHEDNGTVVTGTPCPNVLEENAADPLPVMAVSDASANEANGSIGFLVSLDKPAAGTVTVDYRTENVTATAPGDYTQTSGTLTFDPGETQKMVTVPIIDDTVPDNGETFKLVLSNVSGAKLGDAEAVGTILNTETPILTGFTLVNAETGSDVGAIDDGGMLTLDDPANGSYGLVAAVASDAGVGSVRLALTGAKTATATDNAAPWSLYGGANGQVQGEGLPAGSYTLSATAYAEAGGGGAELGTLSVSFSVAASEAVAPDALTASFTVVPAAHEGPGSGAFVLELQFSEEPELSYSVLRNESLAAKDGSLGFVRRLNPPLSAGWKIKVRPSGWDDVTVTLAGGRACGTEGAVCTKDGKVLANTAVATVPGPLALSVADARVDEAANAVLAFEVTLNRAAAGTVTVGYATADSTATAGADYTATSGTLTFAAGETSRTVNVAVLDDAHDEGEETLTLTLSNPSGAYLADGTATGTIENSDPIPQAWLARFGRTVSGQVLDAIEERLRASRTAGVSVRLAGETIGLTAEPDAKPDTDAEAEKESQARLGVLSDWLRHETEDRERAGIQSRTMTAPELLMGSS